MKTKVFVLGLLMSLAAASATGGELKGKVTDQLRNPLPGATIYLQGTDLGTTTDLNGDYNLKAVPEGTYTLMITSVGFEPITQEVDLRGSLVLNFKLTESVTALEGIVVTGVSASTAQKQAPIQIESIRLKQISNQIKDLADALIMLPGVRVQSSGSMGDRAEISLNGLTGQSVRTYIDGLPFEFLYPALSINNLPLVNISRLDVYKGVVPVDVGTDAMAGALNVVSENRINNSLDAFYSIGSFNTHQFGLNGGFKLNEQLMLQLNAAYNYSDNNYEIDAEILQENGQIEQIRAERFNDAYELRHADISLIAVDHALVDFAKLTVGYTDYAKEVNNNVTISRTPWGEYLFTGDAFISRLLAEKELSQRLKLTTNFAYSYSSIDVTDTSTLVYAWDGTVIRQNDTPGEFEDNAVLSERNNRNFINRTSLVWTLSAHSELLLSNVYAYQDIFGRDVLKAPEDDVLTFPQDLRKNVTGLQYTGTLGQLTINLGAKYYDYALTGIDGRNFTIEQQDSRWGGYAAVKYAFSDRVFARTSFENGIRIPNAGEFFGNGNTITPNGGLRPESSDNINLEFGYKSRPKTSLSWGIEANGFLRFQQNLIRLSGDEVLPRFINQKGVRTVGAELEAFVQVGKHLRYTGNLTKLEQTITALNDARQSSDQIGMPNPNTPDFFFFQEFTYSLESFLSDSDALRIYAQYYYVDTFNHIPVGSVFNPDNWVPAQNRVNLGCAYSLQGGKYTVAANVFNLFDNELFDNFNVPRPGRNYALRVSYKLD